MGKKKRGGGEKPKKTENRKIKNEAPKIYLPKRFPPRAKAKEEGFRGPDCPIPIQYSRSFYFYWKTGIRPCTVLGFIPR